MPIATSGGSSSPSAPSISKPKFKLTDEQVEVIDLARSGDSLSVEALAGAGKTSTLVEVAAALAPKRGIYAAFNRSIVDDGKGKFGSGVDVRTMHSLAFGAVGHRFKHRLNGGRQRNADVAAVLGVKDFVYTVNDTVKVLSAAKCASLVMRAVVDFCNSADLEPTSNRVPYQDGIDEPDSRGRRGWENNNALRAHLRPHLATMWADQQNPDGKLPFDHACYLKMYEMNSPRMRADFIAFDEAQDCSPVFLSILRQQMDHAQVILVGDPHQSIYSWMGAVDSMSEIDTANTGRLTQSFRFGSEIADVANLYLDLLDADVTMRGNPTIKSTVTSIDKPDTVLCRTNAAVITAAMDGMAAGRRVAVVGGTKELVSFAESADNLQQGRQAYDPQLACFDTWGEVQAYVEHDPNGGDLKLMVKLCEDFGADVIASKMRATSDERYADLIVSTAHKSKGREWSKVRVAEGFAEPDETTGQLPTDEDLRLQYVAATRAQIELDPEGLFAARPEPTMLGEGVEFDGRWSFGFASAPAT